jgi:hypothetical protein
VQNNLFKISGLRAAFGKTITFPVAESADLVWSIPFCAIDDTQNPIQPSNCSGK